VSDITECLASKTIILPVHPRSFQVFSCKLHNSIKPFPKSEVPLLKRLFAELRPAEEEIVVISGQLVCPADTFKIEITGYSKEY
jgi:hypothetical protein